MIALAFAGSPSECDRILARSRAPSAQAAVYRRGRLVWSGSRGRPADRFVVASVTKTYVAAIAMRLVELGRLSLDQPLADFVPRAPNAERITVRMLMRHRSGLPEYFDDPRIARALRDPRHRWTRDQVIDAIVRLGPERPPDRRVEYRNTNYVLLGRVIRRAGGAGPERLLRRHVTRPLRLRRTSFRRGGRLAGAPVPSDAIGQVWTDGGIATSARELARFTDALFGGRLLRRATLATMLAGARRNDGHGLGVLRFDRVVGHDGAYRRYTAETSWDPRRRRTVSVVVHGSGAAASTAARLRRARC